MAARLRALSASGLDGTEYEIDLNAWGTPRRCGMRCRHVRAAQPAGGGAWRPARSRGCGALLSCMPMCAPGRS